MEVDHCILDTVHRFDSCGLPCADFGPQICYVCKKDISGKGRGLGSEHFHLSGTGCVLDDGAELDRHRREADMAETAAIANAKAENAHLDEQLLRIDTGKPLAANACPRAVPDIGYPAPHGLGNMGHVNARDRGWRIRPKARCFH